MCARTTYCRFCSQTLQRGARRRPHQPLAARWPLHEAQCPLRGRDRAMKPRPTVTSEVRSTQAHASRESPQEGRVSLGVSPWKRGPLVPSQTRRRKEIGRRPLLASVAHGVSLRGPPGASGGLRSSSGAPRPKRWGRALVSAAWETPRSSGWKPADTFSCACPETRSLGNS